jgi:hypothetical protein
MLVLHNPRKKATSYVAKITDDFGKTIRMKIPECKAIYLKEQPSNGHLLRIVLPKDTEAYNKIQEIDENICQNAVKNNQKWFNNNLESIEIKEFFRPSLNIVENTMTTMIIDIKDTLITLNDTVIDSVENIDFKNSNNRLSLEIEAQGLYFFPKKFGIRWIVNKLSIYVDYPETTEDEEIDRKTIEEDWEKELDVLNDHIEEDIDFLHKKIESLKASSQKLKSLLDMAKSAQTSESWNDHLIDLSHRITKYYSDIRMIHTQ